MQDALTNTHLLPRLARLYTIIGRSCTNTLCLSAATYYVIYESTDHSGAQTSKLEGPNPVALLGSTWCCDSCRSRAVARSQSHGVDEVETVSPRLISSSPNANESRDMVT